MTNYSARYIKLNTYRDIKNLVQARDEVIKTRSSTRELGIIYDYENMIDEAVVLLYSLNCTFDDLLNEEVVK